MTAKNANNEIAPTIIAKSFENHSHAINVAATPATAVIEAGVTYGATAAGKFD